MNAKDSTKSKAKKVVYTNRKAYHNFQIIDKFEGGLELRGVEVKSLRLGKLTLEEAYADIEKGECWVKQMHINPYENAGYETVEPDRKRKVLLHKQEIEKINRKLALKGYSLVPLEVYFLGPWAKIQLGLGLGKKLHDKREDLKKKTDQREMQRARKNHKL